jgi:hypothetical protein
MEVSVQFHALAALPSEKEHSSPIEYETEWAPEPVGKLWRGEKTPVPSGNRTSVAQPVAKSVYWLSCRGSHISYSHCRVRLCLMGLVPRVLTDSESLWADACARDLSQEERNAIWGQPSVVYRQGWRPGVSHKPNQTAAKACTV